MFDDKKQKEIIQLNKDKILKVNDNIVKAENFLGKNINLYFIFQTMN